MTTVRSKIVAAARWGIANEPRIHYGELRPVPFGRRLPLTTDCSGFVTLCYYLAGAPDPNGLGYSGQGWTGTLLDHQPRTRRLRAGDVVVWGAYPGRHCAIVLEAGRDPLLASHGQERGPVAIRYSAECGLQPAEIAWLGLVEPLDAANRGDEDGAAEREDDQRRDESELRHDEDDAPRGGEQVEPEEAEDGVGGA